MKRILLALAFALAVLQGAKAADNYTATAGSGLTFAAKDNGSGVLFNRIILCDNTTTTQCVTVDSSGVLSVKSSTLATAANQTSVIGTKAPGTAASNSLLAGGIYNSGGVTLTDGQQAALQFTSAGSLNVAVTNANANGQATMANSSPVVIASNQSNLTVIGAGSAGTANSGVVTVQGIASMTPILANPGTAANWGIGATASGPPANGVYIAANGSGATGGQLAGLKTCDLHAKYDASDNGSITMVTGVSGRKVYICGYLMATGGTATNLKLREGSDANCATNAADLTPAYQLVANDKIGVSSAFWTGLVVSTNAYYVCINASAGNAHQAELWYTIQ